EGAAPAPSQEQRNRGEQPPRGRGAVASGRAPAANGGQLPALACDLAVRVLGTTRFATQAIGGARIGGAIRVGAGACVLADVVVDASRSAIADIGANERQVPIHARTRAGGRAPDVAEGGHAGDVLDAADGDEVGAARVALAGVLVTAAIGDEIGWVGV